MSDQKSDLIGRKFPVLDDGHVILLDVMGDDAAIVQAARTSYGKGTKKASEDRDLIRYLMRNRHTSPFEMAEIKLHIRMPMDSWRQMIRHRTASVNEYSTRYSEAIDSCQATRPDQWRIQATVNKQGSGDFLAEADEFLDLDGRSLSMIEREFQDRAKVVYQSRLRVGIAREQARKDLPLSTYTEAVWKCDLKNVLGFLSLRMDGHAQQEIRDYANVIGNEIVAKLFPETWAAFEDYTLKSMTLSGVEAELIRHILAGGKPDQFLEALLPNKRERSEARQKFIKLGVIRVAP